MGCSPSVPSGTDDTSAPAATEAATPAASGADVRGGEATCRTSNESGAAGSNSKTPLRADEYTSRGIGTDQQAGHSGSSDTSISETEHNSLVAAGSEADKDQPQTETSLVPTALPVVEDGDGKSAKLTGDQLGQSVPTESREAVVLAPFVDEERPSCFTAEEEPQGAQSGEEEQAFAAFSRFDFNGDGFISREEMSRAVSHLGLVPFGADQEAVAQEMLAMLKADEEGPISLVTFQRNFKALAGRLAETGIDYQKAKAIKTALLRELEVRDCLIAEGEAHPETTSAADRAVSLAVVLALKAAVADIGDFDLPTFNFAVRSLCTTAEGEPVRLAELLSPRHVGPPMAFVSHMWTAPLGQWPGERPFTYLAGQVAEHFSAEAMPPEALTRVRVWVDLFAISQHPGRGQMDDLDNLEKAVEAAGRHDGTLLVLDPKGLTLRRIWCLLEVWVTAQGRAPLTILSRDINGPALKEVYMTLDVEEAQATMEADKDRIMLRVKESGTGVKELNSLIKRALVASAEAEAKTHENGSKEAAWDAFTKLATMMHYCAEDFDRAEQLYHRALEGQQKLLGMGHLDTLGTMSNLANLLKAKDDLIGAETMYRKVLDCQEKLLDSGHPDTLWTKAKIASLLRTRGDLREAEELYRQVLDGQERLLGLDHTDTLRTMNGLAILLKKKGDTSGAEELYRRALEGRERVMGASHTDTLITMGSLAGLLRIRGSLVEAEQLYRQALSGQEKLLGPAHTSTLTTVASLANLLADKSDQGEPEGLAEVEELYRRALEGQERLLGTAHTDTLRTMNGLARLLQKKRDTAAAEELLRKALEGQQALLGIGHKDTLRTIANLTSLLSDEGDLDGAETLCRRVLERQGELLGSSHPETVSTTRTLANLLEAKGKGAKADKLCSSHLR